MISGRMDDVITITKSASIITDEKEGLRLKNKTEKIIVEVKSIRSLAYLDKPKEPHILQLMVYIRSMSYYGVKKGIILYVDKNNLKTKAFTIIYDHAVFLKALNRARKLHSYLISKTLPPAEAKQTLSMKWSCNYCEYADQCRQDKEK
jgi:CRISPR/Cas system-associated exonuclease Cas4 (RecB family)